MNVQHRKRAVILAAFLFSTLTALYPDIRAFDERFLWVIRDTMTQKKSIDNMINYATRNGFNNLLIQVRGRGDAFYHSRLIPQSELLKKTSFDPLDYVIKKAHENGLKVHAWVNVYLIWSNRNDPESQEHVINTHPEWIDKNDNEMTTLFNDSNQVGYEGQYLAPHHPKVKKYLLSIFREIVALYDLDGLHFDYVRFQDAEYGNNAEARTYYYHELYNQRKSLFNNDEKKAKKDWDNYRRASITSLVRETKEMLLDVRPDCQLSAAVKPNLLLAKNRYYQEWDIWLAAGYLDWVMPMNYTTDLREFANNIDIIYDNLPEKYRNRIMMGIALYNQPPSDAADKLSYTKITRFKGISLFSYSILNKNPNYIADLFHSFDP